LSEEDSEYEEAKKQVFNRRYREKPDPTLSILHETSDTPIEDSDVADLAESAIRRKFGFREKVT